LSEALELVHGTCVAFGWRAALLRGPSGAGKSDLALRFMSLPAEADDAPLLVADDQVLIEAKDGALTTSCPRTIAGKIEVRGIGIVEVPFAAKAKLVLACDLVEEKNVPRLPPEPWQRALIAGVAIPTLKLAPFALSAPLKLKMALFLAAPERSPASVKAWACAEHPARQR
jgi:serine kinase of HPr protein (carbohydrate metabolism regulator)